MFETSMDEKYSKVCVLVKEAYKRYGNKQYALNGVNMTVNEGTIYSLLGPSGCGKTSVLSALVGELILDSGSIMMTINSKKHIGYMPQSICLHEEFSIAENIQFYGHLYQMDVSEINDRTDKLLQLFELPSKERIISELSGGQQRRISLCLAVLHNPQLLILDEPTVGLDIIISNNIWQYLYELSLKENKTVIITTHYIEEARHANRIGLMRKGRILAENNPDYILEVNNCATLEQAFLKLCEEDNLNENKLQEMYLKFIKDGKHNEALLADNKMLSLQRIYAYMLKNIFWMKRNIAILLFILVLPLVQCTLVSLTIGEQPTDIKIALVNHEMLLEQSNGTCYRPSVTAAHPQITCKLNDTVSCHYINRLRMKPLRIIEYNELTVAKEGLKNNDVWALLYFKENYTESFLKRLKQKLIVDDDIIEGSQIKVWIDLSNKIIGDLVKGHITEAMLDLNKDIWRYCRIPSATNQLLINFKTPIYGKMVQSFRQFMTPANAVLFEFFLPIMFTVSALLIEKTSGLLERSLVAGINIAEIAIGHIVLQMIILIIQTAFLIIVFYYIFDNPLEGNISILLLLLLLIGICGMFYGSFIAAACTSFTTASYMAIGSYFPFFMLSGAIWPVEGMPHLLRYMSIILPTTSSVESFRALSYKNLSVDHPTVYVSFISLTIWSIILCLFTSLALRYNGLKAQ